MNDEYTFDVAVASKPASKQHLTDAQWYVCLVAQVCVDFEGFNFENFRFTMYPPNPEIQACFDARMAPHHAAVEIFSVRH